MIPSRTIYVLQTWCNGWRDYRGMQEGFNSRVIFHAPGYDTPKAAWRLTFCESASALALLALSAWCVPLMLLDEPTSNLDSLTRLLSCAHLIKKLSVNPWFLSLIGLLPWELQMLFTPLMGTSELMTPEEIAQKRRKKKIYFAYDSFYCEKYHRTKAHEPFSTSAELEYSVYAWTAVLTLRQRRFAQNANRIAIAKRCALALKRSRNPLWTSTALHHPLVIKHALQ